MFLTDEARYIGYATAFEIPMPAVQQPGKRVHDLLMLGSLPRRVRELYGLGFTRGQQLAFAAAARGDPRRAPADPAASRPGVQHAIIRRGRPDGAPADRARSAHPAGTRLDGPEAIREGHLRDGLPLTAAEPRFVIVTTGRTGSELLVSLLDSHPRIMCDSEILSIPRAFPRRFVLRRSALRAGPRVARMASSSWPSTPASRARMTARGSCGASPSAASGSSCSSAATCFEQVVSSVRGDRDQLHHHRAAGPGRIQADAGRSGGRSVRPGLVRGRGQLRALGAGRASPCSSWSTRTTSSRPSSSSARPIASAPTSVCRPAAVKTDLVKIAPRSVADQMENFDEVAALLSHTRFAGLAASAASDREPKS